MHVRLHTRGLLYMEIRYCTYCDSVRYASRMSRWREATIPYELRVLYTSRARTSLQAVNEVLLNDNVICHQNTWSASLPMPPPRFCPCHAEADPGRCTGYISPATSRWCLPILHCSPVPTAEPWSFMGGDYSRPTRICLQSVYVPAIDGKVVPYTAVIPAR